MHIQQILQEAFNLPAATIDQVIALIDAGNTIPFIARYRKEQTGNLDDQVLRQLADRLAQIRSLQERQEEVIRLIEAQGLLTPELAQAISQARTRTEVDDLYRPFRPKRRTRASIAREQGLQPLADLLASQPMKPEAIQALAAELTRKNPELSGPEAALSGAMDILAETVADDAWVRRRLRRLIMQEGKLESKAKVKEQTVYESYYHYEEPVRRVAGHRVLALDRGEREKVLGIRITVDASQALAILQSRLVTRPSAAAGWLEQVAEDAWKRLLQPSLETEIRNELTEQAQEQAILVFAANLRSLLLEPPVRSSRVLGLDPGYRTGCKLAAVDETGKVLDKGVIYPAPPHNRLAESADAILTLLKRHAINVIAIGNGTASRETELFVRKLVEEHQLSVRWTVVNEAGASVYSASELGAAEFPDFDVSLRSAVSIARRLQDPLAELVKIEPRSIGVGQYQHDISSKRLDETLAGVVEDCVNHVGVDLNTASPSLLSYVAGLNMAVARRIVAWREANGSFPSRQSLMQVPKLGPVTFEQCAGFLRIPNAAEPLDNTSVHPESYARVYELAALFHLPPSPELAAEARRHDIEKLASQLGLGALTLADILDALEKPGRDPRESVAQPVLSQDVMEISDLKPGMTLRGIVRNVADFGAFIDIGVHQDGLVHISELSDQYVRHPLSVVSPGQAVMVRVLQVDSGRKRISLTMKGLKQNES